MKEYDVVIIGGGPAGLAVGISAKNTYADKSVLLIRKEEKVMIPCGIPYVFHTLEKVEDNILPDALLEKGGVDILIDEVVTHDENILNLKSGEEIRYEKLVLATGSHVFIPPIPGKDKIGVFSIKKNMTYLKDLKTKLAEANKVVIIGGGYVGIEMADELLKSGKQIVLVERMSTLLPLSLDPEFGMMAVDLLRDRGAEIILNKSVKEIIGDEMADGVILDDGTSFTADMVLVTAGYRPNLDLAEKFDLKINKKYGVIVDEYLRTSQDNIFAVGDCAAKRNCFTGEYSNVMLASSATAQGRLVGSNLFQIKVIKEFPGTIGSFATKIGDTAFGVSGLTEFQANAMGIDYVIGVNESVDRHPGKLPDASKVYLKLIYSKYSHILLGAQVKGGDSVGELVNMFSVIIQNRMTDMEIDALQLGSHPLLTSSPAVFPVLNATVDAIMKWA